MCFAWLYLKISISKFKLILFDHITHGMIKGNEWDIANIDFEVLCFALIRNFKNCPNLCNQKSHGDGVCIRNVVHGQMVYIGKSKLNLTNMHSFPVIVSHMINYKMINESKWLWSWSSQLVQKISVTKMIRWDKTTILVRKDSNYKVSFSSEMGSKISASSEIKNFDPQFWW